MTAFYSTTKLDPELILKEYRAIGVPTRAVDVTPDVDFGEIARGIYVGNTGNVVIQLVSGGNITFQNVPGGSWIILACRKVVASGTNATAMVWVA